MGTAPFILQAYYLPVPPSRPRAVPPRRVSVEYLALGALAESTSPRRAWTLTMSSPQRIELRSPSTCRRLVEAALLISIVLLSGRYASAELKSEFVTGKSETVQKSSINRHRSRKLLHKLLSHSSPKILKLPLNWQLSHWYLTKYLMNCILSFIGRKLFYFCLVFFIILRNLLIE